ncbi:MAG TPA: HAD-IC family P-type ATPase [Allosphingosinicella sp.]|nr:HAD-IC family P-type ATPase [Allosphingosinicella sp.]
MQSQPESGSRFSPASGSPRWHAIPALRCLQLTASSADGLSAAEASERLGSHGPNRLPGRPRPSVPLLFLRQFRSPLIYLLLAAALVSLATGHNLDAGFIGVVLFLNALVGTVQERRADTSIAALDRLIRQVARVRRDGEVTEVDASEIVPGDVVEIESGMAVPADVRLLASSGLTADESTLTGESMPVAKDHAAETADDAVLAERPNMLHAGTYIPQGRGTGLVVATGLATELGSIQQSLAASAESPPPLLLRLERLSRQIALSAVGLIALFSIFLSLEGEPLGRVLLLAVALAVSAIPEGLPIAVTVALAAATRRMANRNVIVRSLPAVEGLGSCTLIASDKTGTLTQNRLSLERVLLANGPLMAPEDWPGSSDANLLRLAEAAAYCNEVSLAPAGLLVGDSVDVALATFAREVGVDLAVARTAKRLDELPYEPVNRFSAVAVERSEGDILYVKGAPEVILPMCAGVAGSLEAKAEALAREGYRVIALASAWLREGGPADCRQPTGLALLGWAALLDPLRPEAAPAVRKCAEAGISVRMITGDHPETALTISRQLGLADAPEDVVTGGEMAALAYHPGQLAELVRSGRVFARIDPKQKLQIVQILGSAGELVAVTGDGVNDAPALQAAHIGVAMGQSGTDVARSAADLVLADDNFASIVAGVEEGRITYGNVRKIVIFLLATGIAEIGMFLGAVATGLPMPLTAVQLLWLNLVTNGVQDVTLGFGTGEGDELRQPPRRPDEPLVDGRALALMIPPALAMTLLALLMMDWAVARGVAQAEIQNSVLLLVVLFQNAFVLCMRSERRPLWRERLASNPWLLLGVAVALGLQITAMHWPPLRSVLGTSPVDPSVLLFCLSGAALTVAVTEAVKWIGHRS